MASSLQRLTSNNPSQLGTSAAAIITGAASSRTSIRRLVFLNTSAGAVAYSLHLVPSGDTADDGNMIVKARSLAASESDVCAEAEGQVLHPGDTLQAFAGSATAISVTGSGLVQTY